MNEKNFKILVVAAIVGLVLGTIGLGNFLIFGKKTLNLGSYVPWGLWVALYLFFLGLTAGAFLITILTYVFRVKAFASIGPLSAFTVLVVLVCEIIIIGLDLGHMFRAYRFFVTPNLSSMMFWMVVATLAMVVIYFLECLYLFRESLVAWSQEAGRRGQGFYRFLAGGQQSYDQADRERDHHRVYRLSLLSLPVGILFYGINGAIFGVLLDRPLWNTMTPLIFILTALLAGGALITLLTYLLQREDEAIHKLGQVIRFLLVIFLLLEALQIFVGYYSGTLATTTSLNLIIVGPYWWAFWIIHLVLGSIIPLYLLIARPEDSRAVAWACFLIVITFVAVRLNFLIPDQAVYKLQGLDQAFYNHRLSTSYAPNLTEWLVSLWVISLGLLAFLLGTRWLPVTSAGKGEAKHV
jgi:Ni/Fe-hydrogenase subunit HybB-like protein